MMHRMVFFFLSFLIFFCSSCTKEDYGQITKAVSLLKGKPRVTIVLIGDSSSGTEGSETGASYGTFLRQKVSTYLGGAQVSVINSSRPDETFDAARRHMPEDILTFRPDITLVMLGLTDSSQNGVFLQFFKDVASGYFAQLHDAGIFAVVLTTTGFSDLKSGDAAFDRLKEFNDIISFQARMNHIPVIDLAKHLEDLQSRNPDEYRSLFKDRIHLNDRGLEYVADYVFQTIRRAADKAK